MLNLVFCDAEIILNWAVCEQTKWLRGLRSERSFKSLDNSKTGHGDSVGFHNGRWSLSACIHRSSHLNKRQILLKKCLKINIEAIGNLAPSLCVCLYQKWQKKEIPQILFCSQWSQKFLNVNYYKKWVWHLNKKMPKVSIILSELLPGNTQKNHRAIFGNHLMIYYLFQRWPIWTQLNSFLNCVIFF